MKGDQNSRMWARITAMMAGITGSNGKDSQGYFPQVTTDKTEIAQMQAQRAKANRQAVKRGTPRAKVLRARSKVKAGRKAQRK